MQGIPTKVQSNTYNNVLPTASLTLTGSLPSVATTGNLLITVLFTTAATPTFSSPQNGWLPMWFSTTNGTCAFYKLASGGTTAADNFQVTSNVSTQWVAFMHEFSGAGSLEYKPTTFLSFGAATAITPLTMTQTNPNCYLLGYFGVGASSAWKYQKSSGTIYSIPSTTPIVTNAYTLAATVVNTQEIFDNVNFVTPSTFSINCSWTTSRGSKAIFIVIGPKAPTDGGFSTLGA